MKFIGADTDLWTTVDAASPETRPCTLWTPQQWPAAIAAGLDRVQTGLVLDNDIDVRDLGVDLDDVRMIALRFPKWTDGRAYTQARLLRVRLGWTGELRAIGDVVVDMGLQLARSGFDVAVLRPGQRPEVAQRVLQSFEVLLPSFANGPAYYQGDARDPRPRFLREAA